MRAAWLWLFVALQAAALAAPVEFIVELPNLSDEVLEPKLQVAVSRHVLPTNESEAVEGLQRVAMRDARGRELACYLPAAAAAPEPPQPKPEAQEPPTPSELLQPLQGQCVYRVEEWWTYELCHRKQVRQFHKHGEAITAEFLLGEFSGNESEVDAVQQEGGLASLAAPHVRESYAGGTPCDIVDRRRSAEVRYVCGEEGKTALVSVEELHSCAYQATVATPLLCAHPAFRGPEVPVQEIRCYPLVEPPPPEEQHAAAEQQAGAEAAAPGAEAGAQQRAAEEGEGAGAEGVIPLEGLDAAALDELVSSIIRLAGSDDADADFLSDDYPEESHDADSPEGEERAAPERTEL